MLFKNKFKNAISAALAFETAPNYSLKLIMIEPMAPVALFLYDSIVHNFPKRWQMEIYSFFCAQIEVLI